MYLSSVILSTNIGSTLFFNSNNSNLSFFYSLHVSEDSSYKSNKSKHKYENTDPRREV